MLTASPQKSLCPFSRSGRCVRLCVFRPSSPHKPHSPIGGRKDSMKYSSKIRLAATLCLAFVASGPAQAAEKHLTILFSIPDLAFPFFVHTEKQIKDEAAKLGEIDLIVADGQRSSP